MLFFLLHTLIRVVLEIAKDFSDMVLYSISVGK